jgi:phosphoenolpyruvate carboxylase
MNSAQILEEYLDLHQKRFGFLPEYMRPYIARSDPALNSGLVPTVLAIKVALSEYADLAEKKKIALYPIIGSASLPFRGGLTPLTVKQFAKEYSGVRTALIQSAFRYDYDKVDVIAGIKTLSTLLSKGKAVHMAEKEKAEIKEVVALFTPPYQASIEHLADSINAIANQLPKRRERVQHIGLFGYSRGLGKVKLPRAIGFTAALYSLGIPPELIGTGRGLKLAKERGLLKVIEKWYVNLQSDLRQAGKYVNKKNLKKFAKKDKFWEGILEDITATEDYLGMPIGPATFEEENHEKMTEKIALAFEKKQPLTLLLEKGAKLRRSMG